MSFEQQAIKRPASSLSEVIQPDIWGQKVAQEQISPAPRTVQPDYWSHADASQMEANRKLISKERFGFSEPHVSPFGASLVNPLFASLRRKTAQVRLARSSGDSLRLQPEKLWAIVLDEPLKRQNLQVVVDALKIQPEEPLTIVLDESLKRQNLQVVVDALKIQPEEPRTTSAHAGLAVLANLILTSARRKERLSESEYFTLFKTRTRTLGHAYSETDYENIRGLLRRVVLGHPAERDAARSELLTSGKSLPLLAAALTEFRTRGGERWLDYVASILADMGEAAVPALWTLASMDAPEAEYFVSAISNMLIQETERIQILSRLARNPDPDVRRRVAAHLCDLSEASALEVRSSLGSAGPEKAAN